MQKHEALRSRAGRARGCDLNGCWRPAVRRAMPPRWSLLRRRMRVFGQQAVAVDDGGGDVAQLAVGVARLVAQHVERGGVVDGVAFHEDALGPLGDGAAPERAFKFVVSGRRGWTGPPPAPLRSEASSWRGSASGG